MIVVEIMSKVYKHGIRKLVFIAGDKDFKPMLAHLKEEQPDLEVNIVGYKKSLALDLYEMASPGKVFLLDQAEKHQE